ncbi:uncharacterized protein ColSpa_11732 [Colletotrichum spaethianum]|uniref:Uncharacterized protein n=1 Tax=Colletotrichum spaethianum TaxID=700344 RepID=A0AA37PFW4_9PEZI|nr:uncharacterized protein ColSpa_11732 [Colletotrichum spaethianum]GKT51551.1 hypothetical protein ColSpa_11732 [Colletotrichum spaethianum]
MALILTTLYGYVLKYPEKFHWMAIASVVDGYLIVILAASTVGNTYLIDSHPSFVGAILVVIPVTRGLMAFGISKHTTQYLANIGPVNTFGISAAVSAAFNFLGIILYFIGKRFRRLCIRLTH